jgi:outer membrane protein assembly factor BamA
MTRAAAWILLLLLAPLAALAQAPPDPPLVVESLECRGNVSTSCSFILGQLYLSAGDRVDEEEIQNAKLRLLWLRNFRSVSIYLEKGSQRGLARVVVEVVEASAVSKEATLGFAAQDDVLTQLVQGRWTDNNLFGNGKVLDLNAAFLIPVAGDKTRESVAQLSYIDPHLFDSKRYYFSADVAWLDVDIDKENGDRIDFKQLALDLNFGRRFWDFSYFTAGYQYRPISDRFWSIRQSDGHFDVREDRSRNSLVVAYGWNSQDSQYFPTRGSSFRFTLATARGRADENAGFGYSNVWTTASGNTWVASMGGPPFGTRIELQHPITPIADGKQARTFLQLGGGKLGYNDHGGVIYTAGFAAGVRFDSRRFGVVTLYVLGQSSWNR